jgi:hypothetical protein
MATKLTPTDVVLHPLRLRIVQAFLGDRELTTGELRTELRDVATATLYRQVAAMVDGGVLEVADERRVRGAVERTYRLRAGAAYVGAEAAATMTTDDHRRAFLTFVAGLLGDLDRYLEAGDVDPARDGVGYRQHALYLTDEELTTLVTDLRSVVEPRLAHQPDGFRTRRLLSTVLMPARPGTEGRDAPEGARQLKR